MHRKAKSHNSIFGIAWNSVLALMVVLLVLIVVVLFIVFTAQPAHAQNSVPTTASQAATMPQFAAKLAHTSPQMASRPPHPYQPRASYRNPNLPRAGRRGLLPDDDNVVYTNGPINGTTDAWTINFGFVVSNTFTYNGSSTITGMSFGAWTFPGDVLQSVEVSITSAEFGGTTYFDQVVGFTQSGCSGNQYGFNICTETSGNISSLNLAAGTYWMNLSNAVVNNGDPVYWDENSGPSLASENSVGTIPSEAFTILGTTTCDFDCPPECVHDAGNFRIIHNFTASDQSPASGLVIDQAGKLYGTTSGGNNGLGLAYDLAPSGQSWIFTPLYNFLGGAAGQGPGGEILGPERALYGTADGGLQQCGSSGNQYCGVVYRLRPSPFACLTALCSWTEEVIYRFMGTPDGSGPNADLVFDRAGNLYGTSWSGGAYGQGAVYKLTPSNGGWTEKVLYSFTGGSDGGQPDSLVLGQDGNLYGTTFGGGGGQVIFQLVPSGDSWTETVIASYSGCVQSGNGGSCDPVLTEDSSGRFFGLDRYTANICGVNGCHWFYLGRIFMMSPSQSGWQFTILDDTYDEFCADHLWCNDFGYASFHGLAIDAAGNVYGTAGTFEVLFGQAGYVFKLLQPYQEQALAGFGGDDFGNVEVGAGGNVYGTTGACGNSIGTVWQLTPVP